MNNSEFSEIMEKGFEVDINKYNDSCRCFINKCNKYVKLENNEIICEDNHNQSIEDWLIEHINTRDGLTKKIINGKYSENEYNVNKEIEKEEIKYYLSLDGNKSYASTDLENDTIKDSEYSIVFKIRTKDDNGDELITVGSSGGTDKLLHIGFRNNYLKFGQYGDDKQIKYERIKEYLNLGFIHKENHEVLIYVNGKEILKRKLNNFFKGTSELNIGRFLNKYANADYKEIGIYKKALTSKEMQDLNENREINTKAIASYDFKGENPLEDKSGNNHNLVLHGNAKIEKE